MRVAHFTTHGENSGISQYIENISYHPKDGRCHNRNESVDLWNVHVDGILARNRSGWEWLLNKDYVVTLHDFRENDPSTVLIQKAKHVFIHSYRVVDKICKINNKFSLIPQPLPKVGRYSSNRSKMAQIEVGSFGFLFRFKRYDITLRALAALGDEVGKTVGFYFIGGRSFDPELNKAEDAYLIELRTLCKALKIECEFNVSNQLLPMEKVLGNLMPCDMLSFPYQIDPQSYTVSSASRVGLVLKKPMILAHSPSFDGLPLLKVDPGSTHAQKQAMNLLLYNRTHRTMCLEGLASAAQRSSKDAYCNIIEPIYNSCIK